VDFSSSAPPRCARCGYVIAGLNSPGHCPECAEGFDLADRGTYTLLPPYSRWVFWLPGLCLAAGAGLLATMLLAYGFGNWGSAVWIGVPVMMGCLLGYRCRARWYAYPLLGIAAFVIVLLGMMSLSLAGVFCGMMLAAIFMGPLLAGAFAGWLLRTILKSSGFSHRDYLPVLGMLSVPVIWGAIEGRPPEVVVEDVSTQMVFHAPAARAWDAIVFFEEVKNPPPWILRVGLARPLYTRGSARAVGDVKICVYNKGHITKRIRTVEPSRFLGFEVIEQQIGYERDIRLVGGSFAFAPLGTEDTLVTLTTTYRPRLAPRFCWRRGEALAIHTLHRHVLEGMRQAAEAPDHGLASGVRP
jgi:hypothetical protein